MKSTILFCLLLVGLSSAAPTEKNDNLVITDEFFPDELKIYEGKHEIVKIYIPLNKLNFDDTDIENSDAGDVTLFFVEADINGGERIDQGLYVKKGDSVKKLLDHGRDIAAPLEDDESLEAYFATKDGIYQYDSVKNEAVKYGNIDDDLIGIVMRDHDSMYVLSADKKVYKISEDGNKKEKIDDIKNAEQLVIDFAKNLYYVDSGKKFYIVNADGVKEITGLPENYSKITLVRPHFLLDDGGIPIVGDKKVFTHAANGTLEEEDIELDTEISAYALDAALIQYYAKDKKIYEYNILAILLGEMLEDLKHFLEPLQNDIQKTAKNTKKSFNRNRA